MGFLITFVANYAPWIYAACGLTALYQIYRIWQVRAERRQAVFSLEREKATRDLLNVFYMALFLLLAMGLTYFTSTTLAQVVGPLVAESQNPNPNLPFVPTPTPTPLSVTPTPVIQPTVDAAAALTDTLGLTGTLGAEADLSAAQTAAAEAEQSPTPEAEPPTATPEPAPIVQSPVCPDGRAVLLRPGDGERVSGPLTILGTATHDQFQYYKVEFAPGAGATSGFVYLAGGQSPVVNGALASVPSSSLPNGPVTLQLVVVDQTGNWPPPCAVTIDVQN